MRLRPTPRDTALLSAFALGALSVALVPAQQTSEKFIAAQHATAVLAWAQAHCPWAGELQADAPRVQAEDLMAVAAAFDSKIRYQPLSDVCAQAIALAGPVSTPAGTTHTPASGSNVVAAR